MCVQTSRKLWTCLCGNTMFFFNKMRDADVSNQVNIRDRFRCFWLKLLGVTFFFVCVSSVHRESGSQWHDLDNRWRQPGSQLRCSQTKPPDEGRKYQIHCEGIYRKVNVNYFFLSISYFLRYVSPLLSLQAPNAEARELWKGYIRSVAEVCAF